MKDRDIILINMADVDSGAEQDLSMEIIADSINHRAPVINLPGKGQTGNEEFRPDGGGIGGGASAEDEEELRLINERQKKDISIKGMVFAQLNSDLKKDEGKRVFERIKTLSEVPDTSLFNIIQNEMTGLPNLSDPAVRDYLERGLSKAKAVLLTQAYKNKQIITLKQWINQKQDLEPSTAEAQIRAYQISRLEDDASILSNPDWSTHFVGILGEYKATTLLYMDLAKLVVDGKSGSSEATAIRNELKYRAWGGEPAGVEDWASRVMQKERQKAEEDRKRAAGIDATEDPTERSAKILAEQLEKIFGRQRITPADFLMNEKWATHIYQFDINQPPTFYNEMTPQEKREFVSRVRLHHAVYVKRRSVGGVGGFSLEAVSKNNYLGEIANSELDDLDALPGVINFKQEYMHAIDNPNSPDVVRFQKTSGNGQTEQLGLYDCKGESDANLFRNAMINKLLPSVQAEMVSQVARELETEGTDPDEARTRASELIESEAGQKEVRERAFIGEQVALNLLFAMNVFEMQQSGWIKSDEGYIKRKVRPEIETSYFSQVSLRAQMAPMDVLVSQILMPKEKRSVAGSLTEWAALQAQESAKKVGFRLGQDKISEVVIIKDENNKGKMADCWKIEKFQDGRDSRFRIYVPQCYPVSMLGSYLDEVGEVSVDNGNTKMNAVDATRQGLRVNWSEGETPTLNNYIFEASKAAILYQATVVGEGDLNSEDFRKALAKRKLGDDYLFLRWTLYGRKGWLDQKSRLPKLMWSNDTKESLIMLFCHEQKRFIPRNKIYFPWDDISFKKGKEYVKY